MKLIAVAVLLIAAAGGAALLAGSASDTRTGPFGDYIDLVLDDSRFAPNRLDARVGVPLNVRISNRSSHAHDIYFSSVHMPGLQGSQSFVAPGETRTLSLTFDRGGIHTFGCSLPGHAGMTGALFVGP